MTRDDVFAFAIEVTGSEDAAKTWMRRYSLSLQACPIEMLDTEARRQKVAQALLEATSGFPV
jgi:uncharacterized protein (DUF2384 family)